MVTARQRALVEASWSKVRPIGLQVAELLYDRLFELDPLLEDLFEQELTGQGARLMRTIGSLVMGLGDLETTLPLARDIGRRSAARGVRPGHYATFGSAWLWTLEQTLSEDFTPSVRDAWSAAYALLSGVMIEAAAGGDRDELEDGAEPASSVHRRVATAEAGLRAAR